VQNPQRVGRAGFGSGGYDDDDDDDDDDDAHCVLQPAEIGQQEAPSS
jgi:hypothetical protein